MKLLLLDNYDSFTYNLAYVLRKKCELDIIRNDKITSDECGRYDGIVLSPGPGIPRDAGNMMDIIKAYSGKIPILGICLGHQAIGQHLDCKLVNLADVYHGIQSEINKTSIESNLLLQIPPRFKVGRYHSWAIELSKPDSSLAVTAISEDDCIMAIQDVDKKLYGVQFHPESILTPEGNQIILNFLDICKTQAS